MSFSPVPFYNPIPSLFFKSLLFPNSSNIKQLICTRPIPLTTPPQRTCIYKLLSIIRLAFSPTPISLISFRSDLSLPVFTSDSSPFSPPQLPSETLFSFSLFLLFPFFPVLLCCNAASFHCLIQHLFVFYFNQQTAFSIFYAFPAARDIACDNGAAGCRCFQEDVAHAFMIAGKNDTVCFCIKWARV